jgi:P27 family predicted phage terminase small subunit
MGHRGPPPTPTALKLVKGNPGKRELNKREPRATGSLGAPPDHLGAVGKAAWRNLVNVIAGMNLESGSDRRALELLVSTYEEWREARALVVEHGLTYERLTAQGEKIIVARPEVAIAADAMRRLHRQLLEFGLTPSARSRVEAGEKETVDPMEEFLKRGQQA